MARSLQCVTNGVYPRQKKPVKTAKILKFTPHFKKKRQPYVKKGLARKLTEDQARAILVLKLDTLPCHEKAVALAQLTGVSSTTIYDIWTRKSWKHLSLE